MDPSESRNRLRIAALLFLVMAGYYWKLTLTRQFEWPGEMETLIFTRPKVGYMLNIGKESVLILP